jgi:hypothetical protein
MSVPDLLGRSPAEAVLQTDLIAINQADMDANAQYFYKTAC